MNKLMLMRKIARLSLKRTIFIAAILVLWWTPGRVSAGDVSTQPPAIYREKLAALLTPLEEVLHSKASNRQADENGATLLEEDFHYIDDKGGRCIVWHRISKAFNDSAAKDMAESTFTYRKANQKIHLVVARTIMPDGSRIPVQPSAAILESPQRQADYSLYNDQEELRLIFPNVKPGSVTESIVVIEESAFRMPNEFTASFDWAYGWPIQKMHYVVEMPSAMADLLKIHTLGQGVPEMEKSQPARDRVRMNWTKENIAPLPQEWNLTPTCQTGPELFLTTLPDWDAFVHWYAPLVEARSPIKPPLSEKIDAWTKNAHGPKEILDILMAKVASDVRYVGLEFGASDLQPHDCNEVWANQYGDCKDKANLLRAMLHYKGIDAYITLLNTENTGLVEKRNPGYNQFDHAIVAVELEHGKYVFCDPTITYAKPGTLSPNDADRDVLLVKNNAAEWAHTPAADAGLLHYDLDLKLSPDGGLSGWLTQESSGCYGLWNADNYARLDKSQLRDRAHDIVLGFFKGAEIVDVTTTPLEKWDGPYQLKAYFIVPAANKENQNQLTLAFPQSTALFTDLGPEKKRTTPYYLWADTVKVTARIKLPDGSTPSNLPQSYKLESAPADIAAHWEINGGTCLATLEMHTKPSLLQADQFEMLYNAYLSVRAWLDNPLTLTATGASPGPDNAMDVTLEDFPMMPSGAGQLELVDKMYPENGDTNLRRAALRKVMQYFPTNPESSFSAELQLAILDWRDNKNKEAAAEIRRILQVYHNSVGIEDISWGEFMLGNALKDAGQTEDALKIFKDLGTKGKLSKFRRAWSDYQAASILQAKSPPDAIKILRAGLAFDTSAQANEFTLLSKLLILGGHMADLKKEIAQMLNKKPPQFAYMLTQLARSAGDLLPPQKTAELAELIRVLENAGNSADLGKDFQASLESSRKGIRSAANASMIIDNLKKYLTKNPLEKLDATAAQYKTIADFTRAIADAEKDRKPELCLRYAVERLIRFDPDADFPSHLWDALNYADWNERYHDKPEPLLSELFDLSDQLSQDNDSYFDGKLLHAKVLAAHGDVAGSRAIHEELLRNPNLPEGFKVTTHGRLADNLEALHDYPKALEIYRLLEPEINYVGTKDYLLRAAFLNLDLGNNDEAVRLLSLLGNCGKDNIKKASTGQQIMEMTDLVKERQKANAYWDSTAKWWPAWLALEQKLGMKPQGDEQIVPAYVSPEGACDEMDAEAQAKNKEGFFRDLRKIAYGARWDPGITVDLARMTAYGAPGLAPESTDDLRQFTITLCNGFTSDNPDAVRKVQYYLAAAYLDSFQNENAKRIIHEYNLTPQ
ncbi:MAG: DUF3857 domain-containing protein, partial [Chthoniobacteraceae bacterium]